MKKLHYILQKEFRLIFRDRTMLPIIFVVPFVQLLILVHAATFEMKNIELYILDKDMSSTSRGLISKFEGSPFYKITGSGFSMEEARQSLRRDRADMIIHIPQDFEEKLVREQSTTVQMLINAINGTTASLSHAYTQAIIADYNQMVVAEWLNFSDKITQPAQIVTNIRYWFNPELDYKTFMVPGILVLLVTIIGWFLSSMNTVREKEIGTIEQINVTPIKKHHFIIGKLVPFWLIALGELGFGLILGRLLFQIPIAGSLGLLFGVAGIYLLAVMGLGLFIANLVTTQQQSMFISWFFAMIFILMSGLFTPIESMPEWARMVNYINPIAYFIKIIRMIMLKGSGFMDILPHFASLAAYSVIIIGLASWRYRKIA